MLNVPLLTSAPARRAIAAAMARNLDESERELFATFLSRVAPPILRGATPAVLIAGLRAWFAPEERERIGELLGVVLDAIAPCPVAAG